MSQNSGSEDESNGKEAAVGPLNKGTIRDDKGLTKRNLCNSKFVELKERLWLPMKGRRLKVKAKCLPKRRNMVPRLRENSANNSRWRRLLETPRDGSLNVQL